MNQRVYWPIFVILILIILLSACSTDVGINEIHDIKELEERSVSADEITTLIKELTPTYNQWNDGEIFIDELYQELMTKSLDILETNNINLPKERSQMLITDINEAFDSSIKKIDEELIEEWENIKNAFDSNPDVYITANEDDMKQGRYKVMLAYYEENASNTIAMGVKLLNYTNMDDFIPYFKKVFEPINEHGSTTFQKTNDDWYEYNVDIVYQNDKIDKNGFGFYVNSVNTLGNQQPGYVCQEYGYLSTEMILSEIANSAASVDIFIDIPESMDLYTPWQEVSTGHFKTKSNIYNEIKRTDANLGIIAWGDFYEVDNYSFRDKELNILFVGDYVKELSIGTAQTWERIMDRVYGEHLYLMADVQNYIYLKNGSRPKSYEDPNCPDGWLTGYMEGRYGQIAENIYCDGPSNIAYEFSSDKAYEVIHDLKIADNNLYYFDTIHTTLHSSARVGYNHGFEMEGIAEFCRLYWQDVFGLDAESAKLFGDLELGAWIEYYKAEYADTEKDISIWTAGESQFLIYNKGTIVLWCLDQIIRDATKDEKDIFDYFIQRDIYNKQPIEAVNELTGLDISEFWTRFVESSRTEPLPVDAVDGKPVLVWEFE